MSRVKKSMKQKMAAFLAVCMTAGSLPTGMVTAAETRERPEDANLAEIIEFDPVKLKDAMEKAVESDKMVTPPTVVASSSEISGFYGAVYELKDAETLLAADAAMPAQTDVRIFLSPQSEGFGEDGKYELTGTEGMVFMIENQGNEDQGYQLLFGNKITDVIEVESKERLLEAYYNPEDLDTATEAEAETVPETTAPAADNAAESGTGETAGETEGSGEVPETQVPETDPVATESETQTVAEVSILDRLLGTLVAYGAEPTATDSENEAFDKKDDGDQPAEPENGSNLPAGEAPAESQESTEGETAVTDPATTESEEETEAAEEDKTPEAEEEEDGPRFTAVDDRGYVRLTSGQVSASVLVVKSSFDKIDVEEGMSEPMGVEVTTTRRMAKMANAANGISLMNADDETEAVDDNKLAAVAFYETNAADLLARAGGEGESPFTVNLYDYAGDKGFGSARDGYGNLTSEYFNTDWQRLNKYLEDEEVGVRGNYFGFGDEPKDHPMSRYRDGNNVQNIYQGIPEKTENRVFEVLFPDTSSRENLIKVYNNVAVNADDANTDSFFILSDDGTYTYDSSKYAAKVERDHSGNVTELKRGDAQDNVGFWPFGGSNSGGVEDRNNFFGMSLSFDFYKPADGKHNGSNMVFNFSGDDDVWVYLTKKDATTTERRLVLDMGGNHGRMDGSIDFATGTIVYSNEFSEERERNEDVIYNIEDGPDKGTGTFGNLKNYSTYTTQIPGWETDFMKAGEDGEYTLEFYYLERGGISNCKIQFKLPVIPKQGISIQKRLEGKYTSEDEKTAEYSFNIVSSDDRETLKTYREHGEGKELVTIDSVTIIGANRLDHEAEVTGGDYFYIEESIPQNTDTVFWGIGTSGNQVQPVEGASDAIVREGYSRSPIYEMPGEDTGFLFTCTNRIGTMSPEIAKRAWKDWSITDSGVYDITLEVRGDEMTSTETTEGNKPIDLVVVIDKSGSMKNSLNDIKNAISSKNDGQDDIISKLPAGSHLSVVAFSSDGLWNRKLITYNTATTTRKDMYYVASDWVTINEDNIEAKNKINYFLYEEEGFRSGEYDNQIWGDLVTAAGGTHTAGGVVGANNMLAHDALSGSNNPKVVIVMTDGAPTYAINDQGKKIGDGYDSTETYYDNKTEIESLTDAQFKALKESSAAPSIYVVGYNIDEDKASWLIKSNNIDEYKGSNDLDEVIKEMINYVTSSTSSTKLDVIKVTDQLDMKNVKLEQITVNGLTVAAPELWLKEGQVTGTDVNGAHTVTKKGTKLTAISFENGIVTYTDANGGTVATYDVNNHTITWNINADMGSADVKTLTYRVVAVDSDERVYKGQDDTGTNKGIDGYRSNVTAKVTYNDGTGEHTKEFKHPVVIPVIPKSSLTICKAVKMMNNEEIPNDATYNFKVWFDLDEALENAPGGATLVDDENDFTYTFSLKDKGSITFYGIPVGTSYTVTEIGSNIDKDEYVVTDITAQINDDKPVSASDHRPTELGISGEIDKDRNEVKFTNTLGKFGYITLDKIVSGGDEDLQNEDFSFQITKDRMPYGDNNGEYTLSANDEPEKILIQPEDIGNEFTITETDSKGAWKTEVKKKDGVAQEAKSITAEAGDEVTFTNYYYDHSIELTKTIEGDELDSTKEYPFTIQFTVADGETLEDSDFTLMDGNRDPVTDWTFDSETNTLSGNLKKDETIVISDLPQCVTSYTIKEGEVDCGDHPYKVILSDIKGPEKGTENLMDKSFIHTFDKVANQSDEVTFTNRYDYLYGYLKIDKTISDGSNTDSVFTFKVTNEITRVVFYTTVDGAEETTLYVPLGKYTVEEVDSTVRYEKTSTVYEENGDCAIVDADNVSEETPALVIVTNENTGHNYFSDVDTIVNTVVGEQFVPNSKPKSLDGYSSLAASTQTALEMNAGAYLLPNNKIRMQPNNGDEMIQPA